MFFGAVGTAGQRCTSTRRLFLHKDIADEVLERLQKVYTAIQPGDPLAKDTILGPLHTATATSIYEDAIESMRLADADIRVGGSKYDTEPWSQGNFVRPTLALPKSTDMTDDIWSVEKFAPILNVAVFEELEEAIEWNNAVPQVSVTDSVFYGNALSVFF